MDLSLLNIDKTRLLYLKVEFRVLLVFFFSDFGVSWISAVHARASEKVF